MVEQPEEKTFFMLRREKNLTQQDVAKALGVTIDTVANWERGRSVPRLEIWQIKTLCRLLERSLDEIPDSFLSPNE